MITETESGLTTAQYNNLMAAVGDPTINLVLEQYSPVFASHDSAGGAGAAQDSFDAVVCGDVIVRATYSAADTITIETLATEDGGDQAWASQNLVATNIDSVIPVSLAVSGNTVRVFWYDGTNIRYFESVDKGTNWGASTAVGAVADVSFLAATTLTRVHYLTLTAANNQRMHVYIDDGGWSATDSEVYWPFTPQSFDAVVGNQLDDGAAAVNDILVLATNFPPIISRKLRGTELGYELNEVQGLAFLRYQNGRWSDHWQFDVVDEAPGFPSRYGVRLSKSGDWLFLCYERYDGTATYGHYSISLSRSKDGKSWECPYLMTQSIGDPSVLLPRGDHLYLVNAWKTYRSPLVGYAGTSQVTYDITPYSTHLQIAQGDIQQAQLSIGNPESVLDSTSPLGDDVMMQLRVKLGYHVSGTNLRVQTLLADVDTITEAAQFPTDHITLVARDVLARLMTVQADQVNEWDSQQIGGDNFDAADDATDYSGMRHTATQDGSFKTPAGDNELVLASSQSPGIAFNTYCSHAWNGSLQSGIRVESSDYDDWVGVLFRAYDKTNFLNVKYDTADDKVKLYDRKGNTDLELAASSAMSWSVATWYYVKVRFRYSYVWVYTSTDGITWTERIAYELEGVASGSAWTWTNFAGRTIPNLSGRMGYVGYGYSEEDDSYPAVPVSPPAGAGAILEYGTGRIIGGVAGVGYTLDITGTPTWVAANDGLGAGFTKVWKLWQDPWHWETDGTDKTLWGLFGASSNYSHCLMKHENFPNGRWTLSEGWPTPNAITDICFVEDTEDLMYLVRFTKTWGVAGGTCWIYKSVNHGGSWVLHASLGEYYERGVWPSTNTQLALAPHGDGKIFYLYGRDLHGSATGRAYTSDAWTSFTRQSNALTDPHNCFYIKHTDQWSDQYLIAGDYAGGGLRHSDDGGLTWTSMTQPVWDRFYRNVKPCPIDGRFVGYLGGHDDRPKGPRVCYSHDRGQTWTTWASKDGSQIVKSAFFVAWGTDGVPVSALCWDSDTFGGVGPYVFRVTSGNTWTDKTGNLMTVLPAMTNVCVFMPMARREEEWQTP